LAVTVLVDLILADFIGIWINGGIGIIAVALIFRKTISVIVDVIGIGRTDFIPG
jgi:hypothetical protein